MPRCHTGIYDIVMHTARFSMRICCYDTRPLCCCSHRYPTPFKSAGSTTPFWYSVDVGPAHIIMVRTCMQVPLVQVDRAFVCVCGRPQRCPPCSCVSMAGD